ncbi:hypothetical protein NC651_037938 [Populus alba x Populus x berolinensis]|nr:hypothetical protein NC651_037938 [Populus alba x Populus x berolinensis]
MYLPTVAIYGDLSFVLSCLSYDKRTQAAEELNSHIVAAADDPSFLSLITSNHQGPFSGDAAHLMSVTTFG